MRRQIFVLLLTTAACGTEQVAPDSAPVQADGSPLDSALADAAPPLCTPELTGRLVGETPLGPIDTPVVSAEAMGGCWSAYPFDVAIFAESNLGSLSIQFTVDGEDADHFSGTTTAWIGGDSFDAPVEVEIRAADVDSWTSGEPKEHYLLDVSFAVQGAGWDIEPTDITGYYCYFARTLCRGAATSSPI